ncbi:hypothetical protein C8R48DRAFT_781608 [Suillus tomentosus]|nr:hypothetical protein C8R48DRAFT_781608 [Suillus tomentosus]
MSGTYTDASGIKAFALAVFLVVFGEARLSIYGCGGTEGFKENVGTGSARMLMNEKMDMEALRIDLSFFKLIQILPGRQRRRRHRSRPEKHIDDYRDKPARLDIISPVLGPILELMGLR